MDKREEAAVNHRRMIDDDRFGYSQGGNRWGDQSRIEEWSYDGHISRFAVGDRDCSSSVCDVWREALRGTPYEGALDGATYTGNMRAAFVGSGLFDWLPYDPAGVWRGDILLNERDHVAMAQGGGTVTEFSLNESGGIVGGRVGDQTGGEARARSLYNFPWDGILRYNGKADGSAANEGDDMRIDELMTYNINTNAGRKVPFIQAMGLLIDMAYDMPKEVWDVVLSEPGGENAYPAWQHLVWGRFYSRAVADAKAGKDVDPKAVADMISRDLGAEVAKAVAGELAAKLSA